MKAIQFVQSIPRYVLSRAISTLYPPILWSRLSCLKYRDVPEPPLPNEDWVKVKVRYGGICGSDMGLIFLHKSPSLSAFVSFPFTVGHENVGTIAELGSEVEGFEVGERVVVDPTLSCEVRGFADLCPACRRGDTNLCQRFAEGAIAPGLLIGNCHDTGGSWSPLFAAHKSRLFRVPASVSDENGVMVEPFAVALHAVMRNFPRDDEVVLVVGAGVIGIFVVAALRALGSTLHKPLLGKRVMVGGADLVFDCVGSGGSIDDALRFTRSGGRMVLVGAAALPTGIDWTPLWLNEIEVKGSYIYSTELYQGKRMRTFQVALALMTEGVVDLAPLVPHKFKLEDYRRALASVPKKGRSGVIKSVFALD